MHLQYNLQLQREVVRLDTCLLPSAAVAVAEAVVTLNREVRRKRRLGRAGARAFSPVFSCRVSCLVR